MIQKQFIKRRMPLNIESLLIDFLKIIYFKFLFFYKPIISNKGNIYIDRIKTIDTNIKKSNKLLESILQSKRPHEFAFMTHQEMNSENWAVIIEKR